MLRGQPARQGLDSVGQVGPLSLAQVLLLDTRLKGRARPLRGAPQVTYFCLAQPDLRRWRSGLCDNSLVQLRREAQVGDTARSNAGVARRQLLQSPDGCAQPLSVVRPSYARQWVACCSKLPGWAPVA